MRWASAIKRVGQGWKWEWDENMPTDTRHRQTTARGGNQKGKQGQAGGKLLCNCRFSQAAPDWLRMLLCVVVVLAGDKCNKNPKATRIIPIVSYHGTHRGGGGVEESYTGQWAGVFRCCLINDGHCGTEWWAASALTVLHGLARPGPARTVSASDSGLRLCLLGATFMLMDATLL